MVRCAAEGTIADACRSRRASLWLLVRKRKSPMQTARPPYFMMQSVFTQHSPKQLCHYRDRKYRNKQ
ncbi:hypothetical protein COCON_G00118130 [Conger conger]|uniref:Uncharacterized protein n=1 Tax=Conger conger TaxID=82655 RepID=A0A9Q1DGD2_CONCO|nr:hypothetical protein COCON_G00118130 [Conger conger]